MIPVWLLVQIMIFAGSKPGWLAWYPRFWPTVTHPDIPIGQPMAQKVNTVQDLVGFYKLNNERILRYTWELLQAEMKPT